MLVLIWGHVIIGVAFKISDGNIVFKVLRVGISMVKRVVNSVLMEVNGLDIILLIKSVVKLMMILMLSSMMAIMIILMLRLEVLFVSIVVIVTVGLKEFCNQNVLCRLVHLQELSDTDVIILQELDDVHALAVLGRALSHVSILLKELGDGDIVWCVVHHVLGVLVHVVFQELDNGHVHILFVDICVLGSVDGRCVAKVLSHGDSIL